MRIVVHLIFQRIPLRGYNVGRVFHSRSQFFFFFLGGGGGGVPQKMRRLIDIEAVSCFTRIDIRSFIRLSLDMTER